MTNKEFLVEVQKVCHLDMPLCLSLMGSLQKVLAKAAVDQVPVAMTGLGMFTSHKHPEYIQENKSTGSMTLYPPRISYRMTTEVADDAIHCSVLLAQFASIPEEQVSSFIDAFVSVVNDHFLTGEEIEVPGIGYFQNIMTHHSEMHHVSFVPSEQMKELVNAPFSCFEPIVINDGTPAVSEPLNDQVIEKKEKIESMKEEIENPNEATSAKMDLQEDVKPNDTPAEPQVEDSVVNEDRIVAPVVEESDDPYDENEYEPSTNWSLYISLAVILAACGFILWLMFGDSSNFWVNDEPHDAVVVYSGDNDKSTAENVDGIALIEDTEETVDSIIPAQEESVELKEEEKVEVINTKQKVEADNTLAQRNGFHRMIGEDGNPVTVTLKPGDRLTILALNYFGDKAFWPYIFDVNTDKLKAPNLIQAGMTLYLPDPTFYGIDANDASSLQKAKNRGAQLLK